MKFNYEVLTTPTGDTPGTAIQLQFPNKRYFFGQIAEGTQRACAERGMKITSLTDIFLTGQIGWANTGGLIGVILTLADGLTASANALEATAREREERKAKAGMLTHGVQYGVQGGEMVLQRGNLTIHGGKNLTHSLATARRFVFRKGMPVYTKEYDTEGMSKSVHAEGEDPFQEPTWSDANIKVWAMPVRPFPAPHSQATSQVLSKSPRKRSLDEFEESDNASESIDARTRDYIIRQTVVTDMFNSSWRLDSLQETKLAEVRMPAVMFVRNPETKDLEHYKGPVPGSNQPLPDINVLVRKPWPGASVEKIPSTTWCHESLSYIVRNQDVRGKFDAKKAIELKVRKGPDYAKLARGETVTSEDGKMITPDMVLGPARLGKGTAIIDLPTPAYVDDLVNRSEWSSPAVTMNLEVIIWILGPGVGEHPKLHEFVAKMPQCKHTVSSPDYCPNYLSMKSIGESTTRMGFLIPENYPTPVHDNMTIPQPSSTTPETVRDMSKAVSLQPLEPGVLIEMEPKFEINRSEVEPPFDANNVTKMMPLAVVQRMDVISKRMRKQEFEQKLQDFRKDLPGADAEIITLGTGSSAPSKYRNVSSTLLHVPGEGYYLFDCGENTLGQLKRVFPPEKLREVLRNLRVVWISHLHADHHLGTASVLRAWFEENYPDGISHSDEVEMGMSKILQDKRLFVVSDAMMTCWLEEYASVENFGFGKIVPLSAAPYIEDDTIKTRFVYRHCRSDGTYPGHETADGTPSTTALSFLDETSPLTPLLHQATGLANILTCRVSHCRGALAVSLVFPSGFKVSFSGDCRPSASFVAIGQNSTVLIHEATFQDDMAISAKAKKHSTVSEALEVGRRMNARAILLTHFSQRYQKVARVDENDANPIEEASNHVGQVGLDVPDDEPSESSAPLRLTGEIQVSRRPHVTVPVVGAHDYMRIRVSNMLHAQLHAPAVDKLFETLERMQLVEAQKRRDAVREVEKARSKAKQAKKAKHGMLDAPPAEMDVDKPESTTKNEKSVWSASESESGWSTSGSETEEWMDKKRLLYGRSQSPRRSPRHRKR